MLVGKLKKGPKGYGDQLDVTIPPLLAGAISRFTTTVKSGKYVQARCKSKYQKWQAITKYKNHADHGRLATKCKQKKKKRVAARGRGCNGRPGGRPLCVRGLNRPWAQGYGNRWDLAPPVGSGRIRPSERTGGADCGVHAGYVNESESAIAGS